VGWLLAYKEMDRCGVHQALGPRIAVPALARIHH